MKRALKFLWYLLLVLVVLFVAALLLAPTAAKWTVNHYGERLTGRRLHVESVSLNAMAGTVKLKDFSMYEANPDSGRFIHLARLYADVRMTALLAGSLELDSVYLGQLAVHVDQDTNRFNFTDLIERFASTDSTEAVDSADASAKKPLPIVLRHIKIASGAVRYRDLPLGAKFDLNDISLYIPEIDLTDLRAMLGLHFDFAAGGSFSTELFYDDHTHDYDLQLKLADLPLSYGLPYMRQYLYADSVRGRMSTELRIKGNTDHLIQLDLSGRVHCRDLAFYAQSPEPAFRFDSLEVALRGINLAGKELMVSNLALSDLQTSYLVFPDSTTNWSRMARPRDDDELALADSSEVSDAGLMEAELELEPQQPADSLPWHLVVDRVAVDKVALSYVDSTLSPAFRYELSDLTVTMRNFDNQGVNTADVQGVLQQKGSLRLKWRGRVDNLLNQYLSLSVANVDLRDFSPYALAYTAYPITGGTLSFSSENTVAEGALKGLSKLEVYRPQAGDKDRTREAVYKVPLKMALYLVTDAKGYMSLELPVSGQIDEPEFSYKKLLAKTLFNALGRVAASPFSAMGKSLGAKSGALTDFMEIDPQQTELNAKQYACLDALHEFWKSHADLHLTLDQQLDVQEQAYAWAQRALQLDYYRSRHPGLSDDDLLYMDLSAIYGQDISDKAVKAFVEQKRAAAGLKKQKNYKTTVQALYGESANAEMLDFMQRRNQQVQRYLVSACGIPDSMVKVQNASEAYRGKPGYRIGLVLPEE